VVSAGVNLGFGTCRAGLVGRNGVGKTTLLKLVSGELQPRSGKVSVSGSLGFLQQTVQVKPVETVAHLFGVAERLALLRRAEAGEASVEELGDIDWSLEGRILSALGRVGLDARLATYLNKMSVGNAHEPAWPLSYFQSLIFFF
jgi:ATPase subunit of ABC transporter with duplicated ATPase domains